MSQFVTSSATRHKGSRLRAVDKARTEVAKKDAEFGEGSGYYAQPNWIWDAELTKKLGMPKLTLHEAAVFSNLYRRFGPDGACFPSKDRISEDCRIGKRSVDKAITSLLEKGCIAREERSKNGRTIATLYRLIRGAGGAPQTGLGVQEVQGGGAGGAPEVILREVNNKQQHARAREAPESEDAKPDVPNQENVVVVLSDLGVGKDVAMHLVAKYGHKAVEYQIGQFREQNVEAEKEGTEGKTVGWLVAAIKGGWQHKKSAKKKKHAEIVQLPVFRVLRFTRIEGRLYGDVGEPYRHDGKHREWWLRVRGTSCAFRAYDKVEKLSDIDERADLVLDPQKFTAEKTSAILAFTDGVRMGGEGA